MLEHCLNAMNTITHFLHQNRIKFEPIPHYIIYYYVKPNNNICKYIFCPCQVKYLFINIFY